ncbi:hypothetical protein [Agrococcus casei]|uniref:hypothetical protein n=1 Tax=Agrococcus casei TaxID=343512 RepID=UPI003F8F7D63
MTKNLAQSTIARRVNLAMSEAGVDAHSVAQAADITSSDLNERLSGRSAFQVDELVRVGGFLRIPTTHFIKEAA